MRFKRNKWTLKCNPANQKSHANIYYPRWKSHTKAVILKFKADNTMRFGWEKGITKTKTKKEKILIPAKEQNPNLSSVPFRIRRNEIEMKIKSNQRKFFLGKFELSSKWKSRVWFWSSLLSQEPLQISLSFFLLRLFFLSLKYANASSFWRTKWKYNNNKEIATQTFRNKI